MIKQTDIDRMVYLRRQGKTLMEVGDLTGYSATTVRRYTQHIKTKPPVKAKKKLITMGIDSKL